MDKWFKGEENPFSAWADPPYKLPRDYDHETYQEWSYAHIGWEIHLQMALWVLDRLNLHIKVVDHVHRARKTLRIYPKVELRDGVEPPISEEEPIEILDYAYPLPITLSDSTIEWLAAQFKNSQGSDAWYGNQIPRKEAQRLHDKYGWGHTCGTDHLDPDFYQNKNPFLWLDTYPMY